MLHVIYLLVQSAFSFPGDDVIRDVHDNPLVLAVDYTQVFYCMLTQS